MPITLDRVKDLPNEFLKCFRWDIKFKNTDTFKESNKLLNAFTDRIILDENTVKIYFTVPESEQTKNIMTSLFYTEEIAITHYSDKDEEMFTTVLNVKKPRLNYNISSEETEFLRIHVTYEVVWEKIV